MCELVITNGLYLGPAVVFLYVWSACDMTSPGIEDTALICKLSKFSDGHSVLTSWARALLKDGDASSGDQILIS